MDDDDDVGDEQGFLHVRDVYRYIMWRSSIETHGTIFISNFVDIFVRLLADAHCRFALYHALLQSHHLLFSFQQQRCFDCFIQRHDDYCHFLRYHLLSLYNVWSILSKNQRGGQAEKEGAVASKHGSRSGHGRQGKSDKRRNSSRKKSYTVVSDHPPMKRLAISRELGTFFHT